MYGMGPAPVPTATPKITAGKPGGASDPANNKEIQLDNNYDDVWTTDNHNVSSER